MCIRDSTHTHTHTHHWWHQQEKTAHNQHTLQHVAKLRGREDRRKCIKSVWSKPTSTLLHNVLHTHRVFHVTRYSDSKWHWVTSYIIPHGITHNTYGITHITMFPGGTESQVTTIPDGTGTCYCVSRWHWLTCYSDSTWHWITRYNNSKWHCVICLISSWHCITCYSDSRKWHWVIYYHG